MNCPVCNKPVRLQDRACPHCFADLSNQPYPSPVEEKSKRSPISRLLLIIFVGLVGGGAVVWFYWEYKVKPRLEGLGVREPQTRKQTETIRAKENPASDFDLSLRLLGEPLGIAANRQNLIIGNRKEPFGFLRVVPLGKNEFQISQIPVFEPQYNQKVSFSTVAWNGSDYIGYADGAWFQSPNKYVFTVHDSGTFKLLRHHPAVELLGGLAWDGEYYWAATRKNTEDSAEPAYLYKLSSNFEEIARYDPPSVGCQGLAWDGSRLWSVDVFTDSIYLIDIQQDPPRMVHTYRTHFNYLSGVAYDGSHIWVTEYDDNQAHRLNRSLRLAWIKGDLQVASADQATDFIQKKREQLTEGKSVDEYVLMLQNDSFRQSEAVEALVAMGEEQKAIQILQEMLNSDDPSTFRSAKYELEKLGAPVPQDRLERLGERELPADNTEVVAFRISLKDNELYGSWNLHFGENLFSGGSGSDQTSEMTFPVFAKYYLNVEGGTLQQPLRIEFSAEQGSNVRENELLASDLGPGEYDVNIFIHVQYVDQEGTNKVLNNSSSSLSVRN